MDSLILDQANLKHIRNEVRRGRNVHDGYQRGWGLSFGNLIEEVAADATFRRAVQIIEGNIGCMRPLRIMNLFLILKFYLPNIPSGNIIEFGSFAGWSAMFMAGICQELYPSRKVFALDTFEGMPATDPQVDVHVQGDFNDTSYEAVRQAADAAGLDNLVLVKGLFEDTTPALLENAGQISLAHIDCDIKSAVAYAHRAVSPFMVPGGYLVFDDATEASCMGATEAVEEIIQAGNFSEQISPHYVFRHDLGDSSSS